MLKEGISDPRNKILMKMLNMIGIGESAGSGVPNIYFVWENQGWVAPKVIEEYAPDILKLSFVYADVKRATEKTEKQMEHILGRMQPGVEVEEAAKWLNVGRTRARALLKMLVADGKISETGQLR